MMPVNNESGDSSRCFSDYCGKVVFFCFNLEFLFGIQGKQTLSETANVRLPRVNSINRLYTVEFSRDLRNPVNLLVL